MRDATTFPPVASNSGQLVLVSWKSSWIKYNVAHHVPVHARLLRGSVPSGLQPEPSTEQLTLPLVLFLLPVTATWCHIVGSDAERFRRLERAGALYHLHVVAHTMQAEDSR